jgi:hypothetical protein
MFFHPDDHAGTSHTNALRLFKRDANGYKVTRENSLQFGLIVDLIAAGLSFRQVESVLNMFKARTGLAKIGCINDTGIANNARALCGINMQMIRKSSIPHIHGLSLLQTTVPLTMDTHISTIASESIATAIYSTSTSLQSLCLSDTLQTICTTLFPASLTSSVQCGDPRFLVLARMAHLR